MAKAVGPVFDDAAIAAAVDFRAMPLSGGGGVGCGAMDDNEACAISAAGCEDGCSGDAAAKIAAFLSCNEQGWHEFVCSGGDAQSSGCVSSADLDKASFDACKANSTQLEAIHAKFDAAGAGVHSFPKVTINGHDHSRAQDTASMKAALCKEGVQAACGSTALVA